MIKTIIIIVLCIILYVIIGLAIVFFASMYKNRGVDINNWKIDYTVADIYGWPVLVIGFILGKICWLALHIYKNTILKLTLFITKRLRDKSDHKSDK